MFVGTEFPGDQNETLKMVQHGLYIGLVGYIYHYARERYLKSASLIGVETELARQIKPIDSFDHRVLQAAHDKVAAHFRYRHDDGGQLSLFSNSQEYEAALRERWVSFLHEEARSLAEIDAINLAILGAVAYANSERGMAAENLLGDLLKERYGDLSRPKPDIT